MGGIYEWKPPHERTPEEKPKEPRTVRPTPRTGLTKPIAKMSSEEFRALLANLEKP